MTLILLIYGTGGFAYGQEEALNVSNTRTGWTAGGGVEWPFAPHWSVKAEYLFVQQGSGGVQGPLGFTFASAQNPQINVVRGGVNYHFNFAPPAPVVAKY